MTKAKSHERRRCGKTRKTSLQIPYGTVSVLVNGGFGVDESFLIVENERLKHDLFKFVTAELSKRSSGSSYTMWINCGLGRLILSRIGINSSFGLEYPVLGIRTRVTSLKRD